MLAVIFAVSRVGQIVTVRNPSKFIFWIASTNRLVFSDPNLQPMKGN